MPYTSIITFITSLSLEAAFSIAFPTSANGYLCEISTSGCSLPLSVRRMAAG